MPDVLLYEVGPRDGLQNEPEILATAQKLELVTRLAASGLRRIEVASFVSPRWIPQLADAERLLGLLPELPGLRYSVLVPNERGYERFRAVGRDAVAAVFLSASETHNRKNLNCSIAEQCERIGAVVARAHADGVALRAYVSTVCGCPYEGEVPLASVVRLVDRLMRHGVDELSLGDTIGVGRPAQVTALVRALAGVAPLERLALHCHDTYGRAVANVQAAYEAGIRVFDASLGGLGGCPYAPGASGNAATEDLVDLFEGAGITTGVDLDRLVATTAWLEDSALSRPLPGRVYRARRSARARDAEAT